MVDRALGMAEECLAAIFRGCFFSEPAGISHAVIGEVKILEPVDEAAAMQQQADAAAAAHEKTLADARVKAQGLAQAARDRLAAEADAKRKALEDELAARLALAERRIAATRARARTNVESIARDAAAAIFERILGRPADGQAIAAAVAAVKTT